MLPFLHSLKPLISYTLNNKGVFTLHILYPWSLGTYEIYNTRKELNLIYYSFYLITVINIHSLHLLQSGGNLSSVEAKEKEKGERGSPTPSLSYGFV